MLNIRCIYMANLVYFLFPGKKNSVKSQDEGLLEPADFTINALFFFLT
jgi:hypothetical protein